MSGDSNWVRLDKAAELLEDGAGDMQAAKLLIVEWLRDGLLTARADRLIEHRLIEDEACEQAIDGDPLRSAIMAGVLSAWEKPTQLLPIEAPYDMAGFNWSPIPPDIGDHQFWVTGRLTCDDGNGTRARRQYIGVKVERAKVLEAAAMYDIAHSVEPDPAMPQDTKRPGRPNQTDEAIAIHRERVANGKSCGRGSKEAAAIREILLQRHSRDAQYSIQSATIGKAIRGIYTK